MVNRIAFSGDQHIEARHLTTFEEQELALTALVDGTVARGCRALVLLGDTTHGPRPGPLALQIWGRALARLEHDEVRVIALAGNHEREGVTTLMHYFRGSITTVVEPDLIRDVAGVDLAILPWLPDAYVRAGERGTLTRQETAALLTQAARDILAGFRVQKRPGVPLLLATHATIAGAETSTGFNMGFVAGDHYIIPTEELVGFDAVFAGHIHRGQVITDGERVRAAYTGSLLPLDFSETEPKSFLVYDVDRETVERVVVPTPRIITLDLVADSVRKALVIGDDGSGDLLRDVAGAKVRVRISCDEAAAREFPPARVSAALYAAGASLVQVELEIERPERPQGGIAEDLGPAAALARYLDTRPDIAEIRGTLEAVADLAIAEIAGTSEAGRGDLDLLSIEVSNLLGVHDARIVFDDGVFVLTGPVGSGKSTVGVDGPRYALFGESRAGSKMADRLIRHGADVATAAVTLQDAQGHRYKVIRKTKRTPRGPQTTLDVLWDENGRVIRSTDWNDDPSAWRPLSTGKIVDGEREVAKLLGGLTDETMKVGTFVVQREADSFTRARADERKRILASAAGLDIYDRLGETTKAAQMTAERDLSLMGAQAAPLRTRVAALPGLEREIDEKATALGALLADVQRFEDAYAIANTALADERDRQATYDALIQEAAALQRQIDDVDADLVQWGRKYAAATTILEERDLLEGAKTRLVTARALVELLEKQERDEIDHERGRHTAQAVIVDKKRELERMAANRRVTRAEIAQVITQAEKSVATLANAECPVIDGIRDGDYAPCRFLVMAKVDETQLPSVRERHVALVDPTPEEEELGMAIAKLEDDLPTAGPHPGVIVAKITKARDQVRDLEKMTAVAEKIAAADQIVKEHDEAVKKLQAKRVTLVAEKSTKQPMTTPNVAAALRTFEDAKTDLAGARGRASRASEDVAEIRGRITTLREARDELAVLDAKITTQAMNLTAWIELVRAWRSCRVMVLETSVIPAVERAANDILRRFPYGLQVSFATQRDKRSGEGQIETLDVEVLGGRGALYELCSGGERTSIDTALHIAVALVVARRASTRLRFLVVDEPEGLDEPGRMAFAAVVRSLHEENGLTVLAMSHMADMVDAIGGRRLIAEPGPDGSTVRAA